MAKKYWIYKGQKIPTKKYYPKIEKTSEQLFKELIRKTGQVNRRLKLIKKEFGSLGWAGESLSQKADFKLINAWTSKGIKIKKSMSKEQLKAISKMMDNFLKSKTSTIKGIRQTMKLQVEGMKKAFSTEDIKLTTEESRALFKRFEDKDYTSILRYLTASELNALIEDSKEHGDNLSQFIERSENYITGIVDEDLRVSLESIYYKYVRS